MDRSQNRRREEGRRGGRGRGRGRSRGRGRGRGRGGRRGGRGRGGYDWTRHLPDDHPRKKFGLGYESTSIKEKTTNSDKYDDSIDMEAEYVAFFERQNKRMRQRSEHYREEFERISAHAKNRLHELELIAAQADAEESSSSSSTAMVAARQVLDAMDADEREALLERYEARAKAAKGAFDHNPERVELDPEIKKRLRKTLEAVKNSPSSTDQKLRELKSKCEQEQQKQYRPRGESESLSYFRSNNASDDTENFRRTVESLKSSPAYRRMLEQRKRLPAFKMSSSIADALLNLNVTTAIVAGETGCGKTTQVPRILIEAAAASGLGRLNILVAQPRRIAAMGVAERYAEEGGTGCVPGEDGCDAGYHIRHERRVGKNASVVFATTGVILRVLAGDPKLSGVDVVIVDEVHERSADGDFLVTALRDLALGTDRGPGGTDKPLRLILMSATVDANFFVDYLSGGSQKQQKDRIPVPVVQIPGSTYPTQDFYLEDAVKAVEDQLTSPEDIYFPPIKLKGELKTSGSRRQTKIGERMKGDRHDNRHRDDEIDCENSVRSRRHTFVSEKLGMGTFVADLVQDFDVRARIAEKHRHLKSISSGDIPIGLAFWMVLHLDAKHRPKDDGDGAILVFLPGIMDITTLADAFRIASDHDDPRFCSNNLHVLTLHGSMPTIEQRRVFLRPPGRQRKVILATNVAESSITVDDVVFCLDLGKHKEKTYDPSAHIECLLPTWISQASARQRRGRAGRVRAGECWHLYPSWYMEDGLGNGSVRCGETVSSAASSISTNRTAAIAMGSNLWQGKDDTSDGKGDVDLRPAFPGDTKLRPFALPEMLRTPLEELCLRARHLNLAPSGSGGIERFLERCPSPPGPLGLYRAMDALGPSDMMLIRSNNESLTPIGEAVALIPASPRVGLALMLADGLGCEEEILTICAILSGSRSPFYTPIGASKKKRDEADAAKRRFAEDLPSDIYASARAYYEWEAVEARSNSDSWTFCRSNFVSKQAMITIRQNRRQLVRDLENAKKAIYGDSYQLKMNKVSKGNTTMVDGFNSFDQDDDTYTNALYNNWGSVLGVLASAFGNQLARLDHGGSGKCRCPVYTRSHGKVKLFPSSVSSPDGAGSQIAARGTTYYMHRWGIYMEKVRSRSGIFLYDINEISPLAVAVCTPGERRYSDIQDESELLCIESQNGAVKWGDSEMDGMVLARDELQKKFLSTDDHLSEFERVGASIELENLESRLGTEIEFSKSAGDVGSGRALDEDAVLNFVVSALESNGGTYPMARLRGMMKADPQLYEAMGSAKGFAEKYSSVISLDKVAGKWLYSLRPREKNQKAAATSTRKSNNESDNKAANAVVFYGPKSWVYYDIDESSKHLIQSVRSTYRKIINARVMGCSLSSNEKEFLHVLAWALQEDFST